jgi:hypothetical protein
MMAVTSRPGDGEQVSRWETDGGQTAAEDRQAQAHHVARQLEAVAERLCREFSPGGGPAAEGIRTQVREARDAFGSPHVIAYLPVLVERTVRRRLQAGRDGTAAPDRLQ